MIGRSVKCKLRFDNMRQVFSVAKAIEWGNQHKYHLIGFSGNVNQACVCKTPSCIKTRAFIAKGRMHWDPIAYSFKKGPKPLPKPVFVTPPEPQQVMLVVENVGDTPVVPLYE